MKSNRIKLTAPVLQTRFAAEATVRQICELQNQYQAALTAMNEAVTAAKKDFEEKFAPLQKQIDEKSSLVQAWAEANPSEFNGAKSLDLVHGLIGWRTGQPQLKTLSGFTWDRVLESMQKPAASAFWAAYIRTKADVDKQAILADRANFAPGHLREIGVKVLQEEAFFIQPKVEQTETRITADARP